MPNKKTLMVSEKEIWKKVPKEKYTRLDFKIDLLKMWDLRTNLSRKEINEEQRERNKAYYRMAYFLKKYL